MAKIKNKLSRHSGHYKPRGLTDRDFNRVYWPYLPLIAAICLLLGLLLNSSSLSSLIKHPTGRVLGYSTTTSLNDLLNDTNQARTANHETTLKLNAQLDQAAQAKANDMASRDYWSHNTPDGQAPWTFVTASGYSYQTLGENLASGFDNDQAVINAWLASPTHRKNLLSANYSDVGFGFANIADYKAAGGGPMTLVVAYYASPYTGGLVTTSASGSGNALGDSTSRMQLAIAKSSIASWSAIIIAVAVAAAGGLLVGRHYVKVKRSIKKSERYVFSHPLVDACFIAIIFLLVALSQTTGLVK